MVTTTHDPAGGGRPRLVVALGGIVMVEPDGSLKQAEFDLLRGVTRIGSSPSAMVRLPGLDVEQAEVVWDQFDEYVFVQLSSSIDSRINGERMGRHPLRTGDRVEMGDWTLTFIRDEYADHGRPYGGRQGGEGPCNGCSLSAPRSPGGRAARRRPRHRARRGRARRRRHRRTSGHDGESRSLPTPRTREARRRRRGPRVGRRGPMTRPPEDANETGPARRGGPPVRQLRRPGFVVDRHRIGTRQAVVRRRTDFVGRESSEAGAGA